MNIENNENKKTNNIPTVTHVKHKAMFTSKDVVTFEDEIKKQHALNHKKWIKDQLGKTLTVPKIHEDQAPVIPDSIHPSHQRHLGAFVG